VARGRIVGSGGEEVHAATFLRKRRIVLDGGLRRDGRELRRIVVHELFHFAWLRLSNAVRRSWEDLLAEEISRRRRGELGWSAEWRKNALSEGDIARRTRRWREYCCESYCDTAAWLYAGLVSHDEFTLNRSARRRRAAWFFARAGELRV
jgi:hypothetical protein